jgi:uncharacterized protein
MFASAHKRTVRGICLLNFRQMKLEDKALFARYTEGLEFENTELSFTNLFIWRQGWKIEICEHDGALFLSYAHPETGRPGHMQPIVPAGVPVKPAVEAAFKDLRARACGSDIMGVNDDFIARFKSEGCESYVIEDDRDLAEYVYLSSDLAGLEGKKYHSKRNHLNKFLADTAYTWQELTPEMLPQCLSVCRMWLDEKPDDANVDMNELYAIKEAVTNMHELGLIGALVCVDGKPRAFTVGERFRPNMALVHLEKADSEYPGIFAFINQQFIFRNFRDMEFVNREEDMGIPGLRRAKESYYPHHMVNKYRILETKCQ